MRQPRSAAVQPSQDVFGVELQGCVQISVGGDDLAEFGKNVAAGSQDIGIRQPDLVHSRQGGLGLVPALELGLTPCLQEVVPGAGARRPALDLGRDLVEQEAEHRVTVEPWLILRYRPGEDANHERPLPPACLVQGLPRLGESTQAVQCERPDRAGEGSVLVVTIDAETDVPVGKIEVVQSILKATRPVIGQGQVDVAPLHRRWIGLLHPPLGDGQIGRRVDSRVRCQRAQHGCIVGEPGVLGLPETIQDPAASSAVAIVVGTDEGDEPLVQVIP